MPCVPDGLVLFFTKRSPRRRVSAQPASAHPRALEAGRAAHRNGRDAVAAARTNPAGLEADDVAVAAFEGLLNGDCGAVGATRLIENARRSTR